MNLTDFLADFERRGLLHQVSSPELAQVLRSRRISGYIGFDPTADSLHIGSLLQIINLVRLQRAGHRPVAVVGGGTGLIGDPSGKEAERSLLTAEQVEHNVAGVQRQLEHFLELEGDSGAIIVNNAEWLCRLNFVEFLRDIGKHFSVNQMIVRDSVRMRLETREHGLSYTEFSYMLLQAYDYLALHDRYGCVLQMGGSDQWGNIVSGADLIRRLRGAEAYALTCPLLTRSDGKKFGKSEEGNIWLSAARTSPYHFYQYWLNVPDDNAVQFLKFLTLLPLGQVEEVRTQAAAAPEQRLAQKTLAEEMTRMVHGPEALARALRATEVLFNKDADYRTLSAQELSEAFQGVQTTRLPRAQLGTPAAGLLEQVVIAQLYPSKGRARKDLPAGAVSVNNVTVQDAERVLSADDVLPGGFIILRKGKKHYHVLRVVDA